MNPANKKVNTYLKKKKILKKMPGHLIPKLQFHTFFLMLLMPSKVLISILHQLCFWLPRELLSLCLLHVESDSEKLLFSKIGKKKSIYSQGKYMLTARGVCCRVWYIGKLGMIHWKDVIAYYLPWERERQKVKLLPLNSLFPFYVCDKLCWWLQNSIILALSLLYISVFWQMLVLRYKRRF